MSQYPGGQLPPPHDPYYGQPPADPYASSQQAPPDPYYGAPPPGDPYAPPPDPYYGGQPTDGAPPQGYWQQPGWGAPPPPAPPPQTRRSRGGSGAAIFGLLLVIVGVWVLFGDQLDLDLEWSEIWPIAAVIIGALMVLASFIPGRSDRQA